MLRHHGDVGIAILLKHKRWDYEASIKPNSTSFRYQVTRMEFAGLAVIPPSNRYDQINWKAQ